MILKSTMGAMCIFLSVISINVNAAFLAFPVESGVSITAATIDVLGTEGESFGAVPVDVLNPASGDFDFMYLATPGFGFNSTFYESPGIYNFDSTPDVTFPDVLPLSMNVEIGRASCREIV